MSNVPVPIIDEALQRYQRQIGVGFWCWHRVTSDEQDLYSQAMDLRAAPMPIDWDRDAFGKRLATVMSRRQGNFIALSFWVLVMSNLLTVCMSTSVYLLLPPTTKAVKRDTWPLAIRDKGVEVVIWI
jgi:hypothetical protein